jgi:chemotaxis family two-component system sensor kinase Cph1
VSAVSLTTVDLDNCDQEPIHIPGFIQPHGALIALDAQGAMTHRSSNAPELLSGLPQLGQLLPYALWSTDGALKAAIDRVLRDASSGEDVAPFAVELTLQGVLFDVVMHAFAGRVLVEFERRAPDDGALATFPLLAHRCMSRLKGLRTIEDILAETVTTVRELTGFDRVMAYRFMYDDSGEVVAEARAESMEPFAGLRFPASDIPVQARRLYVLNTLRLIADVHDPQVPLEALVGYASTTAVVEQPAPLDLSHSLLRSISPIHIEYLKNIGVAASMSLSIVIDGRLWGLIACHHREAHRVPYAVRMACDLLAQFVGAAIQAASDKVAVLHRVAATELRLGLADSVLHAENVLEAMAPVGDALKASMSSDGVVLMHHGKYVCDGATTDAAVGLSVWLEKMQTSSLVAVHELTSLPEELRESLAPMSGLMAICFDPPRRGWIVLLRLEQVKTITWSGPPDKVERIGPLGSRLTPKGSMGAWQQVVKGLAVPWDASDRALGEQLGDELRRASSIRNAEIEAARTQLLTMLGHDLRDPLHTMTMVGKVLTKGNPDSNMGHRIATSAGRMQRLIMQVLDISRLQSGQGMGLSPRACDVAALVRGLVDEAKFSYPGVAMQFDSPETLPAKVDADRISQVFSNLVSNARHHGAVGEPICVTLNADDTLLTLTVTNVAPPIAPEVIELMHDPFKTGTLNPSNARNPGGLGLGLYIASEVTRAHGGTLRYAHDGERVSFAMEIPCHATTVTTGTQSVF